MIDNKNIKQGLVLEGGAMRGLFTAGVLDVFLDNGITFDGMIGVSAGAAFGSNFKSLQKGRVLRYNVRFCKDPQYCSFRSLIRTGDLYGADFCYRKLPNELDIFDMKTFDENPMEFFSVVTDAETGKAVYVKHEKDPLLLVWLRASASMPLASRPVNINGKEYLDGGIADSVPIKYFEKIGYEKNVIILTQPAIYRKNKNSLLPLMKIALRKYPALVKTMENRHVIYNETLDYICKLESEGKALVIRPDESLNIGHVEHDPQELERVYEIGKKAGIQWITKVKEFLY